MEFDPNRRYSFSARIENVDPAVVTQSLGPAISEFYCWLANRRNPEVSWSEEAIAKAIMSVPRREPGLWDKERVLQALMALRQAGFITLLYLGPKDELDAL